jgi:hypothetical protein
MAVRERSRPRQRNSALEDIPFPAAEPIDQQSQQALVAIARLLARQAAREFVQSQSAATKIVEPFGEEHP